jgi:hypothetical protein
MISKEAVLECIKAPMEQFHRDMVRHFGNWNAQVEAAEKILAGENVDHERYPKACQDEIQLMKLIMKHTTESRWDWSNPEIQKSFQDIAAGESYKIYSDTIAGIIRAIITRVPVGTLVELGTGPGGLTRSVCEEMITSNRSIPLVVTDRAPSVAGIAQQLRQAFPSLTIHDFVWDVRESTPPALLEKLARPVLLFERWCVSYGGYNSIHNIAPAADILLMVESLSLSGIKMATDILFGRIGLQFYALSEARELLGQYFPFIHVCDEQTAAAINLPTASIILAMKQYSE